MTPSLTTPLGPWSREECIAHIRTENEIGRNRPGRRKHPRGYADSLVPIARMARRDGMTWRAIGTMLDVPYITIWQACQRAGVTA